MKKEYIFEIKDFPYVDYIDANSLSARYKLNDDSDTWYIMGIDVAEEPESVKRQKERDKKIDTILN